MWDVIYDKMIMDGKNMVTPAHQWENTGQAEEKDLN